MAANAWLVRPFPHEKDKFQEFKTGNIVAVGWPGIGDLSDKSREDIKELLKDKPYKLESLALGNAYATIDIIVNGMNPGDLLLVPHRDDIAFAEVISDYQFDPSMENDEDGYPHQRKVKWLATTTRSNLSKSLRCSLKVHRTTADLSKHADEIAALAAGESFDPTSDNIAEMSLSYPLRPDFSIQFSIPSDIAKEEADRLSKFFSTLYFSE